MKEVEKQLVFLGEHKIDCVIVGGVAGTVHGSSIPTRDLDICYNRAPEHLSRLSDALRSINARLRGVPPDLPFIFDEETLSRGLNFTFQTDVGDVDLLGEVAGVGTYVEAKQDADVIELLGFQFQVLSLPKLIAAKRASARPKDLIVLAELEAIYEFQKAGKTG